MFVETLARVEHVFRPLMSFLPDNLAVRMFSAGRTFFAERLATTRPADRSVPIASTSSSTIWDKTMNSPLWNAAGMFKKGEGYTVAARQGAGAWVAGTTTSLPRIGNTKAGVTWPVAVYPRTRLASNWLGLPNPGHAAVAARISKLERHPGCLIGASVSADPGMAETEALQGLVDGMNAYDAAGVDYLELNESCPNVPGHHDGPALDDGLIRRLEFVHQHVLAKRRRHLPVVVKFSVDTSVDQLEDLLVLLVTMGFDGVILGNTSIAYHDHRQFVREREMAHYDYFTSTFGGGLSGAPLSPLSLNIATLAVQVIERLRPANEFNIIRCGGVSSAADLDESREHGIQFHQWYTGYYEAFARYGHDCYRAVVSPR